MVHGFTSSGIPGFSEAAKFVYFMINTVTFRTWLCLNTSGTDYDDDYFVVYDTMRYTKNINKTGDDSMSDKIADICNSDSC